MSNISDTAASPLNVTTFPPFFPVLRLLLSSSSVFSALFLPGQGEHDLDYRRVRRAHRQRRRALGVLPR
jgi:hypothetical protein